MALTVNTNMASINAYTRLSRTNTGLTRTFERIASGSRITSAADDAAGLAVAENLNANRRASDQAKRNVNDAISMIQIAEGGTAEIGDLLKRMKELAVQSASDTLATTERSYLEVEFVQLSNEITRIAETTSFNGVQLGSNAAGTPGTGTGPGSAVGSFTLMVQVGISDAPGDQIALEVSDLTMGNLVPAGTTFSVANALDARDSLAAIDDALTYVNTVRAGYGSMQNRFETAMANLETSIEGLQAAESQIRDADFAYETAEMARLQIMQQAGVAILGQANQINQGAVSLLQG